MNNNKRQKLIDRLEGLQEQIKYERSEADRFHELACDNNNEMMWRRIDFDTAEFHTEQAVRAERLVTLVIRKIIELDEQAEQEDAKS